MIAFSCTSAGVARGSEGGHPPLAGEGEGGCDRRLGADFGAELIERRAPFDADGRDRRGAEFFGAKRRCAGQMQTEGCQPTR